MNYAKIEFNDTANGLGVGIVLWIQGCRLHCSGCHNPQTWSFNDGYHFLQQDQNKILQELGKSYISRLTISGGHPLEPENVDGIYSLLVKIKAELPQKDIWLYTGYTLDILNFTTLLKGISAKCIHHNIIYQILHMCDVVVDGPYIEEQRDITLPFCGSKNQRLIDVKETLKQGQIVQYKIN